MEKFEQWKGSAISLMGDPSKKRSTVTKAVLFGLLGIMTAKAVIAPVSGHIDADLQAKGGIEHTQLKSYMSDVGQKLNAEYGSEHTVIVLHNEPELKFIIANAQAGMFTDDWAFASSRGEYRSQTADFVEQKLGVQFDKTMIARNNFYDNVMDNHAGPQTSLLGADHKHEGSYDGIAFINGWGGTDMMDYRSRFPIHADLETQNAFAFFHELTHAVDTRDGRDQSDAVPFQDITLHTEAIADLGTALVFYKKTGNLDEWNNTIKPFRLALSQDYLHSTNNIVDAALKTVDLQKTSGMSDREIMVYSKVKINETIAQMSIESENSGGRKYSQWDLMRRTEAVYAGPKDIRESYYHSAGRWLDRISDGHGTELVRDHGRKVMEASLNNLAYNGKFAEHSKEFTQKLEKHIEQYQDQDAAKAMVKASASGTFDEKVFAQEMNFKIDYDSALRKGHNDEVLHSYFAEKTGQAPLAGFEMKSIEHNVKNSVIARYAEKAVDYVANKSGLEIGGF